MHEILKQLIAYGPDVIKAIVKALQGARVGALETLEPPRALSLRELIRAERAKRAAKTVHSAD